MKSVYSLLGVCLLVFLCISTVFANNAETIGKLSKQLEQNFHNLPDDFTKKTGAIATIFFKYDNEFVRVVTSLQNQGTKAVLTTLDHSHPGYKQLLRGETYTGYATLFGRHYYTQYVPIKDDKGHVLGLLFVGLPTQSQTQSNNT
jgi:hypothetical protein